MFARQATFQTESGQQLLPFQQNLFSTLLQSEEAIRLGPRDWAQDTVSSNDKHTKFSKWH